MHALKVRNGFRRRSPSHQEHTKVIVGVPISRLEPQSSSEFFLRQVELLLGDVDVAQIVMGLGRLGGKLQSLLERCNRVGEVLSIAFDDPQQVVTLHAGMLLDLLAHLRLSFIKMTLLD